MDTNAQPVAPQMMTVDVSVTLVIEADTWRELGWGEPTASEAADWVVECLTTSRGAHSGAVGIVAAAGVQA